MEEVKSVGQISPNSIICADCLEAMKYIKDKSIDMVLCDCLLYTSDAADDLICVVLGGRRIITKTNKTTNAKRRTIK